MRAIHTPGTMVSTHTLGWEGHCRSRVVLPCLAVENEALGLLGAAQNLGCSCTSSFPLDVDMAVLMRLCECG